MVLSVAVAIAFSLIEAPGASRPCRNRCKHGATAVSRRSLTGTLLIEHCENRFERVGVLWSLVVAPAKDSREAHGDARFMASRAGDPLEAELENKLRLDGANRSKL